jgi:hypothetical protein
MSQQTLWILVLMMSSLYFTEIYAAQGISRYVPSSSRSKVRGTSRKPSLSYQKLPIGAHFRPTHFHIVRSADPDSSFSPAPNLYFQTSDDDHEDNLGDVSNGSPAKAFPLPTGSLKETVVPMFDDGFTFNEGYHYAIDLRNASLFPAPDSNEISKPGTLRYAQPDVDETNILFHQNVVKHSTNSELVCQSLQKLLRVDGAEFVTDSFTLKDVYEPQFHYVIAIVPDKVAWPLQKSTDRNTVSALDSVDSDELPSINLNRPFYIRLNQNAIWSYKPVDYVKKQYEMDYEIGYLMDVIEDNPNRNILHLFNEMFEMFSNFEDHPFKFCGLFKVTELMKNHKS